jgi:branched-subunit amino acid aminotransferase/4-amino-4-deoxychorismate lyase
MTVWCGGQLLDDDAPLVAASDRVLEHGVGLFETLRTWAGRALLLPRHLARLVHSADALRLPLDPADLPGEDTIAAMLAEVGWREDAVMRITVSGGSARGGPCRVWMQARPLPPPVREAGAAVILGDYCLSWYDVLARHKTLNYWAKDLARDRALALGADEALLGTPDGRIWEATRLNLFLVRDRQVITPSLDGPVLPGIMRKLVLELADRLKYGVHETDVRANDIDAAREVFLTNAVRGIVPVGFAPAGPLQAPGPVTRALMNELQGWITLQKRVKSGDVKA